MRRARRSRRRPARRRQKATGQAPGTAAEPAPEAETVAQDMERCETCGDFVAVEGVTDCGRDACPYPG